MNMNDTFKPVIEGMEFHVIDSTGFPDAVLVSNGGKVTDGTYRDKYYYPVVYCKHCIHRHNNDGSGLCPMYDENEDGYEPQDYTEDDNFCKYGDRGDEHDTN